MLSHLKFADAQASLAEKIAAQNPEMALAFRTSGVDLRDVLAQVVPLVVKELDAQIEAELNPPPIKKNKPLPIERPIDEQPA